MNLILLTPADALDGKRRFVLKDERSTHIREVLRAEPGRFIRVGLLDGPFGSATILSVNGQEVSLDCEFEKQPPPRPDIDLVLAIPRPKTLRKLLPEVAAFGVDRIVLIRTWRVAKPYLSTTILTPEEYRPLLFEGMMQGRHTHEPRVLLEPLFKPFIEDKLPVLFNDAVHRIVAHPTASQSIASHGIRPGERVVAVLGPEGGLIPYEVDALEEKGFVSLHMGPSILRVETACVALMAQVQLLRMIHSTSRDS